MRRLVVGAVAAATTAVAVGSVGLAAAPPRAKIALGGRGFATSVAVTFAAPRGYVVKTSSGYNRTWRGPRWKNAVGDERDSLLDFSAHSDFKARSAEGAAKNQVGSDPGWKVVASGPIAVPHLIKGHKVGVIKGFMLVLQKTGKGYEGWHRAAVGFPLGKGYPVLVADFLTTSPSDDASDIIENVLPSQWNRQAVDQALQGVALDGNLAPRALQAGVHGARVTGRVVDGLGHGVVGVKVTLRKQGSEPCCSATTSATGAFAMNVPQSAGTGAFVLSVSSGGVALTKSVRIR